MRSEKSGKYSRILGIKILKLLALISVSFLFFQDAQAQYFPGPPPVPASLEHQLLSQLKSSDPSPERIKYLLQLANLFYHKSSKVPHNLQIAKVYADEAISLIKRYNDQSSYNEAQLFAADILIDQNKMQDAEKILPSLNDTTKVNLLLTLSFNYANKTTGDSKNNQDSALYYVNLAKPLAVRLHQRINTITCLKYLGSIHAGLGDLKLGEQELTEAIKEYKDAGYQKLQYTYLELAQIDRIRGDFDKALLNTMQALHYMKLTRDSTYAGDFYLFMSLILSHDSQHEQALKYARLAYDHIKFYSGYADLTATAYEITTQLISLHEYQQALLFVLGQYRDYPPNCDEQKELYLGTIGDCYLKLKQFGKAEKYFTSEFKIRKKTEPTAESTYHRMAFFYIETKQYSMARPYLLSALKYLEQNATMSLKNHLHYMLYLADSASGDYMSAMKNLSLTKKYDDTMYKANKVAEVQKLLIQYDAQNKNDQIKLLKQRETLQDANLKQASRMQNLTVGGIIALLIAGFIFYRQNLRKQQDSRLIAQKNCQLERLLNEKEWLLKEVHHRVKNNLYTVFCLLEIQAEFLKDDALKAIENCQRRIFAMSLIHQKLYLSEDVKTVNMADYIRELVSYLKDSFESKQAISYDIEIAHLSLDISQAMPLGLIINEAISNSIKYAFPDRKGGTISIRIQSSDQAVVVNLTDDGIGYGKNTELENLDSLGLKLMKGLSEDINAKISFENKNGAYITIIFKPTALTENIMAGGFTGESEVIIEN